MPTTITAPERRRFTLDDSVRDLLVNELDLLCASIGDHVGSAVDDDLGAKGLRAQSLRLELAIVLAKAVEAGELGAIALMNLPRITALVEESLRDYRQTLETVRDHMRHYIVRDDPDYSFSHYGADRAESIAEYRRQVDYNRGRVAACERFLAAVDDWQARATSESEDR